MEGRPELIEVFGDDSFVVKFEPGNPIRFELRTFNREPRAGTLEPFSQSVRFAEWTPSDRTDSRIVLRGYRKWTT